jgi:MoaA/NifB/PqqE/SkfB family radical SAM enzyme
MYSTKQGVDSVAIGRLDLMAKLYQPGIYDAVTKVARGQRSKAPVVVDLDPTSFCDLACPECISGKLLNKGRFTRERLGSLAEELVSMGVKAVILIGGGEPLAHSGTQALIYTLGRAGIAIGVVTNGTMIDRNLPGLAEHASWVRVSVDAATTDTYRRFRPNRKGVSVFDHVIDNMRRFAAVKKGALGYSFLVMVRQDDDEPAVSNHYEVLAAAELAKGIGCDYFEVKAMFDEGHHIVGLAEDVLASIMDQLKQARSLEDANFEIVHSSTLDSVRDHAGPIQPKAYHRCRVAELRTLVTSSGVYICPYHRGNSAAMLGDAVTDSLVDIWSQSERGIIDPNRDCAFHCARHTSNLELHQIAIGKGRPVLESDLDPFI